MNLCLDDQFSSEAGRYIFCLLCGMGYGTWLGGNAKFCEEFAGLKFVNIHVVKGRSLHALREKEKNSFIQV